VRKVTYRLADYSPASNYRNASKLHFVESQFATPPSFYAHHGTSHAPEEVKPPHDLSAQIPGVPSVIWEPEVAASGSGERPGSLLMNFVEICNLTKADAASVWTESTETIL